MWRRPFHGQGGRGPPPPPPQQQQPQPPYVNSNPSFAPQQPNYSLQDLAGALLLNYLPLQQQNPNYPYQAIHNPSLPIHNPSFQPPRQPPAAREQKHQPAAPPPQPKEQLPALPPQKKQSVAPVTIQKQQSPAKKQQPPAKKQQPSAPEEQPFPLKGQQQPAKSVVSSVSKKSPKKQAKQNAAKEQLEPIERALEKAHQKLLAAKENVSAWKVSQAVLVALQVDSWDSLRFKMQEVPSLHRLLVTEGKINAFIHCFVGVRRITTLHDLEVSICQNEGIGHFEELELGPLTQHPLVLHYFSMDADVTEVFKITTVDVILALSEFMNTCKKKAILIDDFLSFLAKKHSVEGKKMLGVRVQSLGMHISFIQEARGSEWAALAKCQDELARSKGKNKKCVGSEDAILKKCQEAAEKKLEGKGSKRPLFSLQKKGLDRRFSAVRRRVESFASENTDFCGKHVRFVSSSSEDDESDDTTLEDKVTHNDVGTHTPLSLQYVSSSDRVSSCPYPSAIEERSRLGLIGEMGGRSSPASASSRQKERNWPLRKKRKHDDASCNISMPSKLLNRKEVDTIIDIDLTLSIDSIRTFVTSWKEACKESSVSKVLERMLELYNPSDSGRAARRKAKTMLMFSSDPFIGLLNVALRSIKFGMWDSIYDTFQAINQLESTSTLSAECSKYESIDIEPAEKNAPIIVDCGMQQTQSATVEEIIGKVTRYYELDYDGESNNNSLLENKFMSLRRLCNCELWLGDQFGVKEFKSLGYGEFFAFLEKYPSQLPTELQKLLAGDIVQKAPLEVSMDLHQLIVLVSQALTGLWENKTVSEQMIYALLKQQFPVLSFKIMENDSMEDFLQIVGNYKNNVMSQCVIFSATLLEISHSANPLPLKEDSTLENTEARDNSGQQMTFESVTSKDAIEVLLRAPMLSDLNLWSHWDLKFAPALGPLVGWLLSEANAKELLCLVTKDGKVIRIDQSATADSFLEAAFQRSSYQTAVKLLSVFSLSGGGSHVPLSLLKCYAHRAFEVIAKDHSEDIQVQETNNSVLRRKVSDSAMCNNLTGELPKDLIKMSSLALVASRFVLDCLGWMPSEFYGFAADVLLSGMRLVVEEAPSAILCECNHEEHLILHEIGLSMGILEWIDDYNAFSSTSVTDFVTSFDPTSMESASSKFPCAEGAKDVTLNKNEHNEAYAQLSCTLEGAVISSDGISHCVDPQSDGYKQNDATMVVESIRKEEFGLDPNLSSTETSMLKKQHARLGRALHCLSQELYSQDSHFILELVQNADDNTYPEKVEPTLAFILQESGIIVLNNEQGFSAQNIEALCDVGNSTKKGSGGGYIGQKGIGFKSVFRITDAPEIHSNGFHIKFDISEGQIGFVLPTVIPPRNVSLFNELLSTPLDQVGKKCWNTCIVLPFRSKLSESTAMKMFSDLHPSLLLFLQHLHCIMFRNILNDSLIVMRKEIFDDGIVKVSCGNEKMSWLVASQKLQAHASRPRVQTTEIAIAFTLEESDNGEYSPHLEQQPVFAFLPLRTYGLKFILQGDFILPSSREEVDRNNPWNEWLLTKFPGLFVNAERSFCALPSFRENPGKAVAAFMSFVPVVGEVQGFFSGLPKAITRELRQTSCLLLEGDNSKMVPPCNVLRGWDEQARYLLPEGLLRENLGLGFLDRNIILSDSLARALGIAEYGPEILIKFMTYLCRKQGALQSMGLCWLSSWINALYTMLSHSSGKTDLLDNLRHTPFIPLSDGTYSSVDVGTIWLHSDALSTEYGGAQGLEAFPKLCAKLRTVNPSLLSASSGDGILADNIARMLHRIGVQQLSAHEIIKVHVLQAISNDHIADSDKGLMIDYLCYIMIHLQSGCSSCFIETKHIISELKNKAYILTNHGYRRLFETSIHFSKEYGNPININKLVNVVDMRWSEVDISYLKHPASDSPSSGLKMWREFFQELGVTDFLQVFQIEKSIGQLSDTIFKNMTWDIDLISPESTAMDWESHELVHLLSLLSIRGDGECCKYLLEVLDLLWDDTFSEKVTCYVNLKSSGDSRAFKSSFMSKICDVQWIASSMDNKLHYPRDLFYDCDAVHSILGASAPYALPKVKSRKLLSDIGFKTEVTIDDALGILSMWRNSEMPFKSSLAQMSKLYTFIWDEMAASKTKILETFHGVPFIFVPCESSSRQGDLVCGVFLSTEEVSWHDPTGSVDQIKSMHPQSSSLNLIEGPLSKTLCNYYPGLHDFFVKECGVCAIPSCRSYLYILQQLSAVALPSQVASEVFQVFLKWSEALNSGLLSSDDVRYLKECLAKVDYKVLPTVLDKWVSLHPSFGLVCWCDDTKLQKRFKPLDGIDFLNLGDLTDDEQEMLQKKISILLKNLGIPSLSQVVTREAIYYGPAKSNLKASLVNWALPYAQRYIYTVHPDKYWHLKQSGFNNLEKLQIIVVEKLFYKNVIKQCGVGSNHRYECSCLLQGNTLYTTLESDSHALFLELSRLFFDGTSELHFANFLHMITTMAESGSSEEQMEFFIINSQKVSKLPEEESIWLLSSDLSVTENDGSIEVGGSPFATHDQKASKPKLKAGISSNWPPTDWKTAPGFDSAQSNGFKTQAAGSHPCSSDEINKDNSTHVVTQLDIVSPVELETDWSVEVATAESVSPNSEKVEEYFASTSNQISTVDPNTSHQTSVAYPKTYNHTPGMNPNATDQTPVTNPNTFYQTVAVDEFDLCLASDFPELDSSRFFIRDQLNSGTFNPTQALHTGRVGERVAHQYLSEKYGTDVVKWVNKDNETGLPYDIVIGEDESTREYIEVKATLSVRKDWFLITTREWQFAVEKGDSFSVLHVLLGNHTARVTTFRNPVKQCQAGKLRLVVMMPK